MHASRLLTLLLAAACSGTASGHTGHSHDDATGATSPGRVQVLAPGYGPLQFEPPAPGSYALPALADAGDGAVLTSAGERARLHDFLGDKPTLLSFVYTGCSDVNGCPLATAVFRKIGRRLSADPSMHGAFRLISLSFDPERDTPAIMRSYARTYFGDSGIEWRFLTTPSMSELAPILADYGQSIQRDYDEQGTYVGTISHILRVFLIDRRKRIRNIYSVSFLHADTLISDLRTLLAENREGPGTTPPTRAAASATLHGAGDVKTGYESSGYVTNSRDLTRRVGRPADLQGLLSNGALGLPRSPALHDDAVTREQIALGRKLFFDRRLSLNDTFSCAMCHIPEQGFTSNELATAVGVEGRTVRRNAPTIYNVGFAARLFHDGREFSLEQQVWAPLLAHNEMANPSIGFVVEKLRRMPDYAGLFERAFNGRGPGMETIGSALASYERTLISGNSPFDRWHYGNEPDALTEAAKRGFALFTGKARCAACHTVGPTSALFTDHQLHNTGIGFEQSMRPRDEARPVQVAPGVELLIDPAVYADAAESPPNDLGLYEVTQNPDDRWKYKTPTLRNVALTAPYMHNGVFSTLEEVVAFYDRGGSPNPVLDPLLAPLNLSFGERQDLVAFMEALTGDNIDVLISDAMAAPIGDLRKEDPHWVHGAPSGGANP